MPIRDQDKKLMKSKHRSKNAQGRGLFITFDGIEGCGKTTQIKLLKRHLSLRGYNLLLTKEPGGTGIGCKIKSILLNPKNHQITPGAELLLYAADRSQHMEEVRPALEEGKIILCDRFTDATIAYQGYARGIELKLIERLNRLATGGLKPNLTILLDCPVEVGLDRLSQRESSRWRATSSKDRLEGEGIDFHQRVREGYLKIAEKEPRRVKVVDAGREIEIVQAEIKGLVARVLEKNQIRI
jgi:dTMP kinase